MAERNTGDFPAYAGGYDNPPGRIPVLWLGSCGGVGVVIAAGVWALPRIDVTGFRLVSKTNRAMGLPVLRPSPFVNPTAATPAQPLGGASESSSPTPRS